MLKYNFPKKSKIEGDRNILAIFINSLFYVSKKCCCVKKQKFMIPEHGVIFTKLD
jgi:hypothetical protein